MTSTDKSPSPPRNTWQRAAVRDLLADASGFRSAGQLHDELRARGTRVALATVYRTLQAMAEAGEVDTLRTADGEATYRCCTPRHHHHLVCRRCGAAVEIAAESVERWAGDVAAQHGYTDVGHELEVFGLCPDCS